MSKPEGTGLSPGAYRRVFAARLPSYAGSLVAMLLPAVLQFILFAFYARVLGVEQYGVYVALMSWNPICFELVGLGGGEYLVKRAAQDPSAFGKARGHLLAATAYTLPAVVGLFTFLAFAATDYRIGLTAIVALAICEFAGMRLLVSAEQAAISLRRFGMANWCRIAQGAPRILGVLFAYYVLNRGDVESLALAGSASLLISGLAAEWVVRRRLPETEMAGILPDGIRNGLWFTGNQLVRAGQQNIDRVVLAAFVDPATLALYGVAQRFVQVGMLPVQTVLRYTYPDFFREGKSGVGAALRYGLKISPLVVGAAALSVAGLLAISQCLTFIVGEKYEQSAIYVVYLAPVLILFAINYIATDTLSGSGHLSMRTILTAIGVVAQALLFAGFHDGREIVFASYGGMLLTAVLTWTCILLLARLEVRTLKKAVVGGTAPEKAP